jgi:hypothetical protein
MIVEVKMFRSSKIQLPGLLAAAVGILLVLVACTPPTGGPVEDNSPLQPSSPLSPSQDSSPLSTPSVVVPFRLEKPILEGDSTVSGTGPAGVPIIIADVTFMGEQLGAGVIDASGNFVVEVPELGKNHMVGIMLGNLTGTQWEPEDFYAEGFMSDDAMSVAQVGLFYDTAIVSESP